MNEHVGRRLEMLANVSIAIVAMLVGFTVIKGHFTNRMPATDGRRPQEKQGPRPGEKLILGDVEWVKHRETLLLILSKGCRFCAESAEFYRELAGLAAKRSDLSLVAVFPQDVQSGKSYLEQIEVPITEVIQASPDSLGVKGMPTLVLLDSAGVVKESWFGRLPLKRKQR